MGTGSDGRKFWSGTPCKDVDQFQQAVFSAMQWRNPPDVYMCLSRQRDTKPPNKDGRIRAAKSQENALGLKCVWLDLDIKDKSYKTPKEATAALRDFLTSYMPPQPPPLVRPA